MVEAVTSIAVEQYLSVYLAVFFYSWMSSQTTEIQGS